MEGRLGKFVNKIFGVKAPDINTIDPQTVKPDGWPTLEELRKRRIELYPEREKLHPYYPQLDKPLRRIQEDVIRRDFDPHIR